MIILNLDGSTSYSLGDTLPDGAVRVNADGTLYTPPVIPDPAPVPEPPAAPKVDFELQAALARLTARTGLLK